MLSFLSQTYTLISNFFLDVYQKIINDSIGVLKTKMAFHSKLQHDFNYFLDSQKKALEFGSSVLKLCFSSQISTKISIAFVERYH